MPIEIKYEDGLIRFNASNPVCTADVIAAIDRAFGDCPAPFALWDARGVSLSAVNATEIQRIVDTAGKHVERRGANPRSAVVVSDPSNKTLIRLLAAYGEAFNVGIEFSLFCDMDSARAWLGRD
ncbi:MAG: hypothetical protein RIM33_06025 [Alphaproteobacteria bacterium]